jgi:hypothetical protein
MMPSASRSPGRLLRALLWVEWRSFLARIRGLRRESPLLLFVLGGFILRIFGRGLRAFFTAGLGTFITSRSSAACSLQRMLFLIFGFFFVMLIFSNLIIGYSTLFKNPRDPMVAGAADYAPQRVSLEISRVAGRLELGAHF